MQRRTVREAHEGRCRVHINYGGRGPWCTFNYVIGPAPLAEGVAVEIGDAPLNTADVGERCGECQGDDLEVVGIREVRRPARRGEPSADVNRVVAYQVDYRCRTCGCDGFILRRAEDGSSG